MFRSTKRELIILLDVETEQPLEVEAAFTGDFQLEWPAALGGTYVNWDPTSNTPSFSAKKRRNTPPWLDLRLAPMPKWRIKPITLHRIRTRCTWA